MKKSLLIAFICTLIDQFFKILILNILDFGQSLVIVKDFLKLSLVFNDGAAFSILSSKVLFLILISFGVLIWLIVYLKKSKDLKLAEYITYGILIGGITGNLIDRVFRGAVVDYLDFNIFGYMFPVFNFADVCIVISMFLIIIQMVKDGKNEVSSK